MPTKVLRFAGHKPLSRVAGLVHSYNAYAKVERFPELWMSSTGANLTFRNGVECRLCKLPLLLLMNTRT